MKRKALIVGVDSYTGSAHLNAPVKDATSFCELIKTHDDGSDNFETTLVLNPPTKASLKNSIMELFDEKGIDVALFYFSGHGFYDYFGYHMVTPDQQQYDRGVPMNQLLTAVRKSTAKNKVIILDCCYAAGMNSSSTTEGVATYLDGGITILASSRHDEKAKEINGYSVFTNLLLAALKGGAADFNGAISLGSIYAYIDKALGPKEQRPVFKANISEFISLRETKPPIASEIMGNLTTFFSDPSYHFQLDPSFEDTNDPAVEHHYIEPYANKGNITKFKQLQKLQSIGLVEPVDTPYMYFAAMESKACKLTPLGQHYWRMMKK